MGTNARETSPQVPVPIDSIREAHEIRVHSNMQVFVPTEDADIVARSDLDNREMWLRQQKIVADAFGLCVGPLFLRSRDRVQCTIGEDENIHFTMPLLFEAFILSRGLLIPIAHSAQCSGNGDDTCIYNAIRGSPQFQAFANRHLRSLVLPWVLQGDQTQELEELLEKHLPSTVSLEYSMREGSRMRRWLHHHGIEFNDDPSGHCQDLAAFEDAYKRGVGLLYDVPSMDVTGFVSRLTDISQPMLKVIAVQHEGSLLECAMNVLFRILGDNLTKAWVKRPEFNYNEAVIAGLELFCVGQFFQAWGTFRTASFSKDHIALQHLQQIALHADGKACYDALPDWEQLQDMFKWVCDFSEFQNFLKFRKMVAQV